MSFNKENKVSWEELSPSTQELFKSLQTQITAEEAARIAADNNLRTALNNLRTELKNYIDQKTSQANLTPIVKAIIFDSNGRLMFPNNDRFWIG